MAEPFIPRDKPKSWVIGVCAGLCALLIFGPILGLAIFYESVWLRYVGMFGFFSCWCAFAASAIISISQLSSGRYENLVARDWKDQIW